MEAHFEVHYSFRKGTGPDRVNKTLSIDFDDIEEWTEDWRILEMAKAEAHRILSARKREFFDYHIDEIEREY